MVSFATRWRGSRRVAGARRRSRRPGRRVSPEHPRGGRRLPRLRLDRRDLVELLAGLRRAERDRPLRPDRAACPARGRRLPLRRKGLRPPRLSLSDVLAELPTVEHTVVLGYLDPRPDLGRAPGRALLGGPPGSGWRRAARASSRCPSTIHSGCCTARARRACRRRSCTATAVILLEMLKTMHLHLDLQADDRLFWFTTTGWMMWNFVVSGLLSDASIVLYDGNPGTPDLGVLWDLAEAAGITCFGTGAAYIGACQKAGLRPLEGRDLSSLEAVGSTGSPLSPEGFAWVYEALGEDIWLFSTSGGTDVCTAFVGGVPTLPVYQGELQARALGARVEAWSPEGSPLVGEVGELVITEPMPSMPLSFWGDADGSAVPGELLRDVPRCLATRRLDRDHRPRHGDHLRPLRRDDQPRRDQDGHEPRSTAPCWRSTRSSTRSCSTCRCPAPTGTCRCSSCSATGVVLDDELVARIRHADPRRLLTPACSRQRGTDRRGAANPLRQGARAAREAHPARRRRPRRPSAATRSPTPPRSTPSRRSPRSRPTHQPRS